MARVSRSKTLADATRVRRATGQSQTEFWSQFGITQSGGCRYESGRTIPRPLQMLIWLRDTGRISEEDLQDALKGTTPRPPRRVNSRTA